MLAMALAAWAVTFAGVAKASESDYMYLYVAPVPATAGSIVTATVTLTVGANPGGSPITSDPVEFQVFSDSNCTGSAARSSTQTLNGSGQAQTTYATGAGGLAPGSYSVLSTYSGSESYAPVAVCQPFVVDQAAPAISQTAQKRDLSASGGPSITDTATVAGNSQSGSVTFEFFSNMTCTGSPALTETATLSNGTSSRTYTPPSAGAYGVTATYSGDSNNLSASSGCTELTIDQAAPAISTTLTGPGPDGTLAPGTGVTASATVSGGYQTSSGGGTITFEFFGSKANCQAATDPLYTSGPASLGGNSSATSGTYVPSMPGTYYVRTTYSGDTDNAAASDPCTKSFPVVATTTTTTTLSPTTPSSHGPTPPAETGNDDGRSRGCPAYGVVDSRGSGEPEGKLSPPAAAVLVAVRRHHPEVRIAGFWNPYPAVGLTDNTRQWLNALGAGLHTGPLGAYHGSVVAGDQWLRDFIPRELRTCSEIRLILVGYSQGAQVTGDVFQRDLTKTQKRRISEVLLFGDPYFRSSDARVDRGNYDHHRSGALGTRPTFGGELPVRSFCHRRDPVCQATWHGIPEPELFLTWGFKQHENYASDAAQAAAGA